jgi:LysM repeat protein
MRACSSISRAEPASAARQTTAQQGTARPGAVQQGTLQQGAARQATVPQGAFQQAAVPQASAPQTTAPHAAIRHAPEVRGERAAESSPLRLTRRGRSVAVACSVAIASLLWFAIATAAQASDHGVPAHPAGHAMSRIVVQPGQTLWSIATQADPAADPRQVVQQILTANTLTRENITAGQRLWVPGG